MLPPCNIGDDGSSNWEEEITKCRPVGKPDIELGLEFSDREAEEEEKKEQTAVQVAKLAKAGGSEG